MNEYLAIPKLMTIDSRRQAGSVVAPPMRRDFDLIGPMVLRGGQPDTDDPVWTPDLELSVGGYGLSLFGNVIVIAGA